MDQSRWSDYEGGAPSSSTYPPVPSPQQGRQPIQHQGLSPYFSGYPQRQQAYDQNPSSYSAASLQSPGGGAPRTPFDERDPFADAASPRTPHSARPLGPEDSDPYRADYPTAAPEAERTGRGYSAADVPNPAAPKRTSRLPFGLGGAGGAAAGAGAGGYTSSHWDAAARDAKKGGRTTVIITIVILVVLIAGGVTAGVIVHERNSKSSGTKASTASSSGLTQGGDPSNFPKDSRLHQSFWGFAYTPLGSQLPWCGATFGNITEDIQILSQLTTRIHMYGADCNQSSFVLDAIAQTKVNMSVWLGIYVTDNETDYTRQMSETVTALQAFGVDHVEGVIVGNEYILDADPQNNQPAADTKAIAQLSNWMNQTRSTLAGLNLGKTIPVGTADAGSKVTAALADVTDFVMANVHPYFGGVAIDNAAGWTWGYYENPVVSNVQKSTVNPNQPVYIAETGWPTQAMTAGPSHDGGAYPSVPNLQEFLDNYVCQANSNGTTYFFFEAFDEPWKEEFGGVEPYWGLFDADKNLKAITIPDCQSE